MLARLQLVHDVGLLPLAVVKPLLREHQAVHARYAAAGLAGRGSPRGRLDSDVGDDILRAVGVLDVLGLWGGKCGHSWAVALAVPRCGDFLQLLDWACAGRGDVRKRVCTVDKSHGCFMLRGALDGTSGRTFLEWWLVRVVKTQESGQHI